MPKAPILPSRSLRIRRLGDPDHTVLTAYVFSDVIEELIFSSTYRGEQMAAGILIGGYYQGPAGEYIEVRGFRDDVTLDTTLDYAADLSGMWDLLMNDPELLDLGLRPLGWYVSRAGCRGQIGPFELIVHQSFFNLPCHVLLMLDPLESQLGLYAAEDGDRLANIGFNLIEAGQEQGGSRDGNHSPESTGDP